MKKNIIISYTLLLAITTLFGCVKKEVPLIVSSNKIKVSLINAGKYYITGDITAKPKDSIKFSYIVSSTSKMKYVYIVKNDVTAKLVVGGFAVGDTIKPNADHYNLTSTKKFVLDSIPGNYFYQIVARDSSGVYVGSSDPVYVSITTDYAYITNRTLFAPDSTNKTNPCYFNLSSAKAFSYSDVSTGRVNSNQIDFGYYFDADTVLLKDKNGVVTTTKAVKGHTIYNLNISPAPSYINMNNISSFTKNNTYLKRITSTWASLNSGGAIKKAVLAAFPTAPANNYINLNLELGTLPQTAPAAVGAVIAFKTVDGKMGCFTVTYKSQDSPRSGTFIVIEEKILN